jgi:hypothetical protein
LAVTEPVRMTAGGEQCHGPLALRRANVARALRQDRLEWLPFLGRQHRCPASGHMRPVRQTGAAALGTRIEHMVHRLACTPLLAGNGGRC